MVDRVRLRRGEIPGVCFQNTLIRVRVPEGADPSFYEIYLRQQAISGKFAKGSRGVGIHHLGAKAMNEWIVPVPPAAEQTRIVVEVEHQMSFVEAAERAVEAGLLRSASLRRSILKSAFDGKLVPQDPTDEPPAVLLERIRAERLASAGAEPKKTRVKVSK